PAIANTRNLAATLGIDLAMSGSGPSLFALAKDRAHALQMVRVLRRAGLKARLCALGVGPRSTSDRGLPPYGGRVDPKGELTVRQAGQRGRTSTAGKHGP